MRRLLGIVALCCLAACSGGADAPTALPGSFEWRGSVPTTTTTAAPVVSVAVRRIPLARKDPARASRAARRGGRCGSLEDVKRRESGGNYSAQNKRSSASGAYQYLDSTWNGYGGYESAKDAPPHVQDQRAREDWAAGKQRQWAVC